MYCLISFCGLLALTIAAPFNNYINDLKPITLNRVARQLSGSQFNLPGGGYSQSLMLRGGPAWGAMSQNVGPFGRASPKTFSGGLDFTNPNGHGVSLSGSTIPHSMKTLGVSGRAPLIQNDVHRLDALASHTEVFNKDWQRMTGISTGGLDYQHRSGFGANAGLTHTPGQPISKNFGVSYTKHF